MIFNSFWKKLKNIFATNSKLQFTAQSLPYKPYTLHLTHDPQSFIFCDTGSGFKFELPKLTIDFGKIEKIIVRSVDDKGCREIIVSTNGADYKIQFSNYQLEIIKGILTQNA